MANEIQLDPKSFHRKAAALLKHWKASREAAPEEYDGADVVAFVAGDTSDNATYIKTNAVQTWLLGYEFPGTLMMFTQDKVCFMTSAKKAKVLEDLKNADGVPIEILVRTKDTQHNAQLFDQLSQAISSSFDGKRVGVLPKDKYAGKFFEEWGAFIRDNRANFDEVDVTSGVSTVLAVKDGDELRLIQTSAHVASRLMKHKFVERMTSIIDEDKKVKHDELAESTENAIFDEGERKKLKLNLDEVDPDYLDFAYTPIIQSGGKYDLRSSAVSTSDTLHAGTILCSLGIRYKQYCSNVGRTYMVNPTNEQVKNYEFLLELQGRVLDAMKDGVQARDIYNKALAYVRSKRPDLEPHFPKNIGFGMGLEFREAQYTLGPKNTRELKTGMAVNLSLGFNDLKKANEKEERNRTYALSIIDTVQIRGDTPLVLTDDVRKNTDDVVYRIEETIEEDVKTEEKKQQTKPTASPPKPTQVLASKTRSERAKAEEDKSHEQQRRAHQQELAARKQAEGLARFSQEGTGGEIGGDKNHRQFHRFEAYKRETALPNEVRDLQIVVDHKNESVVLPIYGIPVPFHISTLKNTSKSDEGDYVYLRLNFVTPGQGAGKKDDQLFEDSSATFIRSITYRSSDTYRINEIYKSITELKKAAGKKEAARKDMADIVEQDKLVDIKGKRPVTLPDVFIRPSLEGRRYPGELQIHSNGLRYAMLMQEDKKVDILFNNIRFMFFQPCDNELLVVLHMHLHNPVIIGKKKTKDVQFYREVSDAAFDETGNRRRKHHYGDEDELQAEQEERRRRSALNKEFKGFAERVSAASNYKVEVDMPYRDLGFDGVPFRSSVLLQPTDHCLVHLTDPPFLVVPIRDIEIAHLERVQFGLKNFDLVIVFRDFTRPPVHINTIPMSHLENVKAWLDTQDVAFSEGQVNLNWGAIMKTINDDPAAFFEDGGWSFVQGDADDEESDESESASEYELSDEYEDESSDDESSFNEGSSSGSGSEAEEDESGEDWDELERKAKKADSKAASGGIGGPSAKRKPVEKAPASKAKKARR